MARQKEEKGQRKEKGEEEIQHYTKYEKARMIGSRALQIAMGAPFILKLNEEDLETLRYNPVKIAEMEFDENLIPITVIRPLPLSKSRAAEKH